MESPCLLLVEDDPVVRALLARILIADGHEVVAVATAEAALQLLRVRAFAVLLTDLRLGGMDGVALMEAARALDSGVELIIFTGAASLDTAIAAVGQRAAAYLQKPVRAEQLLPIVAAALARRTRTARIAEAATEPYGGPGALLRVGPLMIDRGRHQVLRGGQSLDLTPTEYRLLLYLADRPDRVLGPQQIAGEVLGHRCSLPEARDLVKARIHRLRRKVEEDPAAPRLVQSVRGGGYMLNSQARPAG